MKRGAFALLLIAGACAAGLACSELLYRWPTAREAIGRAFGRGELVAIVVDGAAIYDSDVPESGDAAQLIVAANLARESRGEQVSSDAVEREIELVRHQFGNEKVFESELHASGLSVDALRDRVRTHLRGQQWIEKQIAPELTVSEEEAREFYESHAAQFQQPERYRASHLFLAAPAATPPELIQAKGEAAKALSKRLSKGEDFALLIAEASEDEATKERGGDLGYFAAARMPAEFITEIQKLQLGKRGAPVRLPLGFHIFQLTDTRPARQMPFGEVRVEIALQLANAKRAAAVDRLRARLTAAEFVRTPL